MIKKRFKTKAHIQRRPLHVTNLIGLLQETVTMVMVVCKIRTRTGWGPFVFEAVYIPRLCFGRPSAYFAHHHHHGDRFLQKAY